MSDDVWTVGRLLTWTTEWLGARDSDSPRLDAEVLLAHVRGCPRIALYTAFGTPVSDQERGRFRELVKRRGEGEPVAYLVGSREFFSLPFSVTKDVLVPRPETEGLVVRSIDLCKAAAAPRIIDVGTGSGAIAVTLATRLPKATIVATDISTAAIAVARANAEHHGVANRITFVQCDLMSDPRAAGPWNVIVSNPPYVREDEFEAPRRAAPRTADGPRLGPDGGGGRRKARGRRARRARTGRLAPGRDRAGGGGGGGSRDRKAAGPAARGHAQGHGRTAPDRAGPAARMTPAAPLTR